MGWKDYIKNPRSIAAMAIGFLWKGYILNYFWDSVITATRPELSPLIAFVIERLPPVVFFILAYLLLDARSKKALVKRVKSLSIPIAIAVVSAFALFADMGYMYWDAYIRDPIDWDLASPIQFFGDGTPGVVYVDKFYISGIARKNVVLNGATVVSAKANLSVELLAGVDSKTGSVSNLNEIPKGAKFSLYSEIPAPGQRMTTNQFIVDWPQFSFVFVSNGKRYEYPIDREDIDKMVHDKELASRPQIVPNLSWKQP